MSYILGVKIDNLDFKVVMAKIAAFLYVEEFHMVATVNPEFIAAAQYDEKFKNILNQADLNVPDGVGLKFAGWFLGQKINERITGVDLTWEICKLAAENNYSVYFLGGVEGVPEKAIKRLHLVYPKLKIAGFSSPIIPNNGQLEDSAEIINEINNRKTDILLVALGAPKQEKFIAAHKDQLKVKLAMGIGGTFDYIAGIVPYAPAWMRKLGLEWLYRLFTQPKRWRRIFTAVIVFPWMVFKTKFIK